MIKLNAVMEFRINGNLKSFVMTNFTKIVCHISLLLKAHSVVGGRYLFYPILWFQIVLLSISGPAFGQWVSDNKLNNPIITTTSGGQVSVSDGAGGAIVFFTKENDIISYYHDIYAQRISSSGILLWQTGGVLVNKTDMQTPSFLAAADGMGGAIVAWQSVSPIIGGSYDVSAQKIDSEGIVKWNAQGVTVCGALRSQWPTSIVGDGNGGAVITWWDLRKDMGGGGGYGGNGPNDLDIDIYAQHLSTNGISLWQNTGKMICDAAHEQSAPMVQKIDEKFIFIWQDKRNNQKPDNEFPDSDVYMQMVDSQGNSLWATNGISITNTSGFVIPQRAVADNQGGAFIFWGQLASPGVYIYAQRVDLSGNKLWNPNGILLDNTAVDQFVVANEDGGVIFSTSNPQSSAFDISKIDINGNILWEQAITKTGQRSSLALLNSGNGETIVAWSSIYGTVDPSAPFYLLDYNIYAQKISQQGNLMWSDKATVSSAIGNQSYPQLFSDNNGSAIVLWHDGRDYIVNPPPSGHVGVYAAHLSSQGPSGLVIFPEDSHGTKNTELLLPVRANDFINILSSQFSVNWDPTVVEYVGVESLGLNGMTTGSFGTAQTGSGQLSFSWSEPNLNAATLTNNASLFSIRFKLIGNYGASTPVTISDQPLAMEIIDNNFNPVDAGTNSGTITIDASMDISGTVKYANEQAVQNVTVSLGGLSPQNEGTDAQGQYSFTATCGTNYSITPMKANDPDPLNGIDVQDIAALRRHILNVQPLASPYQIIAGDVNNSGSLSTLDIVYIQALILQINTNFPNGQQWTFVPDDYSFPNPSGPFPYPQSVNLQQVDGTVAQDFIGIKFGDVNLTRDNNQSGRVAASSITLDIRQEKPTTDRVIEIPIRAKNFIDVSGYQFTLQWDTDKMEYQEVTNKGTHPVSTSDKCNQAN